MTNQTVEEGTSTNPVTRTIVDVPPTVWWLVALSTLQVVILIAVAFMATAGG
jgi:hypothetical protein